MTTKRGEIKQFVKTMKIGEEVTFDYRFNGGAAFRMAAKRLGFENRTYSCVRTKTKTYVKRVK